MNPYVRPIGVGDLEIARQRLVRYELGEIAHVENVMAREFRLREHVRRNTTETVTEEEIEQITESEDELQTTERFETKAEAEQVIRNESSMSAGIDVSASYGPVSVSAFGNFAMGSSREEARRNAVTYSKEVVERALSRIQDRVRNRRISRVVEEIIETNRHGFDNRLSGDNEAGVYRWIDKYYLNKIVNYGKRLMLEFYVPEPAAFFAFASSPETQGSLPQRPPAPRDPLTDTPLEISHIHPHNYLTIASQYGFENVHPPPSDLAFVSTGAAKKFTQNEHMAFVIEDLEIPEGYYAWTLQIQHLGQTSYALPGFDVNDIPDQMFDRAGVIDIFEALAASLGGGYWVKVGATNYHYSQTNQVPFILLSGQTGRLPIAFNGFGMANQGVTTTLWCRPQRATWDTWQLETYHGIMGAYRQALQDYEEKIAALAIQAGVRIEGNNPLINRQIEKEELKRGCISLMQLTNIDMPHAITQAPDADHPDNYPQIVFPYPFYNAHIAQFFEERIEWDNMTYEFLPSYYGRKPDWVNKLSSKNNDPVFERFLQAGMAKVRVPVLPKWAKTVLFYLLTGQIVEEESLVPRFPNNMHPYAELYNSYLDDLDDDSDLVNIDEEVEFDLLDDDVWETKVPTNLVFLQADNEFPIEF